MLRGWLRAAGALLVAASALPAQAAGDEPGASSRSHDVLVRSILSTMQAVPAGEFRMGDVSGTGAGDEQPIRTVKVAPFRLGRYEVTFDQYDAFTQATGRPLLADDGWGRGNRPVVNVSWNDTQAFVAWLGRESGLAFRLPSEAEWEYAARAGTLTQFPWGQAHDPNLANGDGTHGADTWAFTAPVGSFPPNAFGIHDMQGNAWEWTQDCSHPSYDGAPSDASAWVTGPCTHRVLRGGGWFQIETWMRSTGRYWVSPAFRNNALGFRLAL